MKRVSATRIIVTTLALFLVFMTGCGGGGSGDNVGLPVITISANPTNVAPGDESTIEWSTTSATACNASGGWSGERPVFGSELTGVLFNKTSYALECTGDGGSSSNSVTVDINVLAPALAFSVSPAAINSGEMATLTWSSTNAERCTASGAWTGDRPLSGAESTGMLVADSSYFLECTSAGGSIRQSVTVAVEAQGISGLDFPGSGAVPTTMRFRFLNPLPIYPATYIWRAYPRQQNGYYTAFFWGNDDGKDNLDTFLWKNGGADSYYGAHPYPDPPPNGSAHNWEISIEQDDFQNGRVIYDRWYTQALRVWADQSGKHHEFYWDLPNTDASHRVIRHSPASWGNTMPPVPALTWGDAPWAPGNEVWKGILRGIQVYTANLSVDDILKEANSPLSTNAGAASIWYLNSNPTPDDISDKSGRGHHPEWVGDLRPDTWLQ